MTADEAKAVDQSLSGTFVGIGVQLDDDDDARARSSARSSRARPAEEAGLKRGDQITPVDGTTTEGETIDQIVSRVRGPEGEPVTLTIERGGRRAVRRHDHPQASSTCRWSAGRWSRAARSRMIRLDQFATGATKGIEDAITRRQGRGRDGDRVRPARQPGRLRQRGGRRREPVRGRRHRLPERRRAAGREKDVPVAAGRPRHRASRSSSSPTATRRAPRRSSRAPSRTRTGARSSARRRSGRAPCSAGSTCRTARRCGSASSAG